METYLNVLQIVLLIELALLAYAVFRAIFIITNAVKNVNGVLKRKEKEIDGIVDSVDKTLVTVDSLSKKVDEMMPDVQGTIGSVNNMTSDIETITNCGKDIAEEAKTITKRAGEESEKAAEVFGKISDLLGGDDE